MLKHDNRCPKCHYSYRSRHHAIHCKGISRSEWRASHPSRPSSGRAPKRTAGQIFAAQGARMPELITVDASYYAGRTPTEETPQ